ncbi:hypothetical protein B0A48_11101 [Cryoendolithus antarcticus]|uniref:Azaphilone pigments biosynthesis cluster protein L N-terminal domain-containing protein n=1 Tax=Cryoendolithus antarcticus TaxID=1507870 RepID=A0A1V8SUZ8_9PEZI|nr:hypothetical protein B0A48_11101 [Cryoendolithus antarcticus]
MAEGLAIAAAVVGIAGAALEVSKSLYEDLHAISNAPKTLRALEADISTLTASVEALGGIEGPDWEKLGTRAADHTKSVLRQCEAACTTFRADLTRWTRHSPPNELTARDRVVLGFYRQKEIASVSQQVQNWKLSFTSIVGLAAVQSSLRNGRTSESINNTLVAFREETAAANVQMQERMGTLVTTHTELSQVDREDLDESDIQDADATLALLKIEQETLKSSVSLLQDLLARSEETAKSQGLTVTQHNVFGAYSSGPQVGQNSGNITNNVGAVPAK